MFDHLHGQFPCGNQHKSGDAGALVLKQVFNDRNQECQRLAGSRLRGGQHILAGKRLRNGRGLHRRGNQEARGEQPFLRVSGYL